MPVQVTITLDSGCFLPLDPDLPEGAHPGYTEIGYYQSQETAPDIIIYADGREAESKDLIKLGCDNCLVELRHRLADGTLNKDGVRAVPGFRNRIARLSELYGRDIEVDRSRFDCILRFDTGLFRPSLVKKRDFKEHRIDSDGKLTYTDRKKTSAEPVAHNIVIHMNLGENESIEIARNDQIFWSSKNVGLVVRERLDVEILADNTTAEKFFAHSLKLAGKTNLWLPNQGDPPPVCPREPCGEPIEE